MLDKKTVVNAVDQYAQLFNKEFSHAAIILFGSYASGKPHENSDIDVGVIFDGFSLFSEFNTDFH